MDEYNGLFPAVKLTCALRFKTMAAFRTKMALKLNRFENAWRYEEIILKYVLVRKCLFALTLLIVFANMCIQVEAR